MSETTVAAIIGGVATVIAAVIAVWASFRKRESGRASEPALTDLGQTQTADESPDAHPPTPPSPALCDALRLGFRMSAAEWALTMKTNAMSAGQHDFAANCGHMAHAQMIRSRKIFASLGLDSPTDETDQSAFIERMADDILARGVHEHTAFRVGRVIGATYFGSVNQTLALAHTGSAVGPDAFDFPMETLDRIARDMLGVDPPFLSEVLNPIRTLWSKLLTSAQQGRSQIDSAERRMDAAIEEVCGLIMQQ